MKRKKQIIQLLKQLTNHNDNKESIFAIQLEDGTTLYSSTQCDIIKTDENHIIINANKKRKINISINKNGTIKQIITPIITTNNVKEIITTPNQQHTTTLNKLLKNTQFYTIMNQDGTIREIKHTKFNLGDFIMAPHDTKKAQIIHIDKNKQTAKRPKIFFIQNLLY